MRHPSIHRPIIIRAWQTAWGHKRLWLFGMFAGLINTGSVLDILFRTFHRTHGGLPIRETLENLAPWGKTLLLYVQKLALVSPTRLGVTVTVILLSLALVLLLALCGQAGLVKSIPLVARKRKPVGFTDHSLGLVGQLFLLTLLARGAMMLLSLLIGSLMSLLATQTVAGEALITFGLLLLFIPGALLISYLSLFGAIEIAANGRRVGQALKESWRVLKAHWLPMSELAIILFMVNLLFTAAILGSIILFAVPYLLSIRLAALAGSDLVWLWTITVGTIVLVLLVLLLFGFMTSLLYSAWYYAYEQFGRRKRVISAAERLVHHFFPSHS